MANCTPWNAIFPKAGCYPNTIKSGVSPQMSAPSVTDGSREVNRMILRNSWNTAPQGTLANRRGAGYRGRWANSSFRIVNNAGDVLSRQNYSCGGSNLVGSHPGMLNLTYGGGQSKANCDGSGIAPSTCNVKYVYDSSDFIRYRKLKALNASYVSPDYSDGGANGLGNKGVKKYSYDQVLGLAPLPMRAAVPLFLADENGEVDIRITIETQERVFRIANWDPSGKTRDEILFEVRSAGFDLIQDKEMIKDLKDKFIGRGTAAAGDEVPIVDTDTFGNIRMDQFQERINRYVRGTDNTFLTFSAAANMETENLSAVEITTYGDTGEVTIYKIDFSSNYLINPNSAARDEQGVVLAPGRWQAFFLVERINPDEQDIIATFKNSDGREFALWNHSKRTDTLENERDQWTALGYIDQLNVTELSLPEGVTYAAQPTIQWTFRNNDGSVVGQSAAHKQLLGITRFDGIRITEIVQEIEDYYSKRRNTIPTPSTSYFSVGQTAPVAQNFGDYYLKYQILSKTFALAIFYKKSNGERLTLINEGDFLLALTDVMTEDSLEPAHEVFYLLEKNN